MNSSGNSLDIPVVEKNWYLFIPYNLSLDFDNILKVDLQKPPTRYTASFAD